MNGKFWKDKRVLLTGHTGFKGGWLSLWLQSMGAQVYGYALAPSKNPNLFASADLEKSMAGHVEADIRDMTKLISFVSEVNPEIVFHMAAQPLVRYSYARPVETYGVNVMGTVNLLESLRNVSGVKAVVNVTTDKCYENREWLWAYREGDALGGYDPYSSSKACSEIVTAAYRQSFMSELGVGIATARAGNVIGGGDWSDDRLIPDFFRAVSNHEHLVIRSPNAIRPWQHVLEPLSGYLSLAEKLYLNPKKYAGAWNFGPDENSVQTVSWILNKLARSIPNSNWLLDKNPKLHEANLLKLDSTKAKSLLKWAPRWSIEESLDKVISWQEAFDLKSDMRTFSISQIDEYVRAAP